MERALERLADQILAFDEASLTSLREKFRQRIEQFDGTREWERAVIIYSIINAVSLKNTLFNENILKRERERIISSKKERKKGPDLRRIK